VDVLIPLAGPNCEDNDILMAPKKKEEERPPTSSINTVRIIIYIGEREKFSTCQPFHRKKEKENAVERSF